MITPHVSPYFLSALVASRVLYNRTEHSQGFSICLYNKESIKFPMHYFQFSKQTLLPKQKTVLSACLMIL